jgi:hypothetical protein
MKCLVCKSSAHCCLLFENKKLYFCSPTHRSQYTRESRETKERLNKAVNLVNLFKELDEKQAFMGIKKLSTGEEKNGNTLVVHNGSPERSLCGSGHTPRGQD